MSTSPRRTSPRFSSSALEGTTLALKVAREVADAVPIVRQVVGSLAYISEFAEVCAGTPIRNALLSTSWTESADQAGGDGRVGRGVANLRARDRPAPRLGRRDGRQAARPSRTPTRVCANSTWCFGSALIVPISVLHSVESFVVEEEAVRGRLRRMIRSVFVAPNRATGLAGQLKREIRLLKVGSYPSRSAGERHELLSQVLTLVSIPIALQQNASYDGQVRQKLLLTAAHVSP